MIGCLKLLVGGLESVFGFFACGNVPTNTYNPHDIAISVLPGHFGGQYPFRIAAFAYDVLLSVEQRSGRLHNRLLIVIKLPCQLLRIKVEIRLTKQFIGVHRAHKICDTFVGDNKPARGVFDIYQIRYIIYQSPQQAVLFSQQALCSPAFGNIDGIFDDAGDIAPAVKKRVAMNLNVSHFAFLVISDMLNRYRLFGFFNLLNRTGPSGTVTRLIQFMIKHITGYAFRQPARQRSRIGHLHPVIIGINNAERMSQGI